MSPVWSAAGRHPGLLDTRHPPADGLYFIAHDYMKGSRRLHPRVLGIGLGAALLGELVLTGNIDVHNGSVYVLRTDPPGDALAHSVLADLIAQPRHRGLRTWSAFLADSALDRVVGRLQMHHLVETVQRRGLLGSRQALMATDVNDAAWQTIRLERLLTVGTVMSEADGFLAGLVSATGLLPHVLWDTGPAVIGRGFLPEVLAALHPALRAIVQQTEAAVGQSVLAPR